MRAITTALLFAAIAVGLAACGGGSSSGGNSSKTELSMQDYYFQPAKVTGKAGDKITLELTNVGSVEHNFTLTDQNVNKDVEPGEEAEVTVTVPKSGTLTFYCEYHRQRGMTGQLTVGTTERD